MIAVKMSGQGALDRLRGFPDRLRARLDSVMQILGAALEDRVRDNLSGRVLNQRSGRLEASLAADITAIASGITVSLDAVGVPYATFQEYGFHGAETVRAHLRTIKQAFGRSIAPRAVAVRAYSRQVDYPAHSFMRSALAEVAPDIVTQIETAVVAEASA